MFFGNQRSPETGKYDAVSTVTWQGCSRCRRSADGVYLRRLQRLPRGLASTGSGLCFIEPGSLSSALRRHYPLPYELLECGGGDTSVPWLNLATRLWGIYENLFACFLLWWINGSLQIFTIVINLRGSICLFLLTSRLWGIYEIYLVISRGNSVVVNLRNILVYFSSHLDYGEFINVRGNDTMLPWKIDYTWVVFYSDEPSLPNMTYQEMVNCCHKISNFSQRSLQGNSQACQLHLTRIP